MNTYNPFYLAFRVFCLCVILAVALVSSLFINGAQALVWCNLLMSRKKRFHYCKELSKYWWNWLYFLFVDFFAIRIEFYGDRPEKGKNNISMQNHCTWLDIPLSAVMADYFGMHLGRVVAFVKKTVALIPGAGPSNYFQGSIHLNRSWSRDEKLIKKSLKDAIVSRPFCLALFPEGTRRTPAKLAQSQEFARQRNLPVFQKVLLPRSKGFAVALNSLRDETDILYDFTVAYDSGPFTLKRLLFGDLNGGSRVCVYMEKVQISGLPESEEGIKKWLIRQFAKKEKLLADFEGEKKFPGPKSPWQPTSKVSTFAAWGLGLMALAITFGCGPLEVIPAWVAGVGSISVILVLVGMGKK